MKVEANMLKTLRYDVPEDVLIQLFLDNNLSAGDTSYVLCRKKVGNWLLEHMNGMHVTNESKVLLQQLGLISCKNGSVTKKGKWFLYSQYNVPCCS